MKAPRDFGWWIESIDEEIYGPVTRATLERFLTEGVISPNTAIRHCTDAKWAPAADQGITDGLNLPETRRTGDTLSKAWPRKTKERLALAEVEMECTYHRRPAILTCIRCHGPYCAKCQMKKGQKTYFMCKKCQSSVYNRRTIAYFIDAIALATIPTFALGVPAGIALGPEVGPQVINLISFGGTATFLFRDPLFGSAGPGKRMLGLKVVKRADGGQVTYWQGCLRSLAHLIPLFNLVDASMPYRDPLQRRIGDKWAKTRVIDTEEKVAAVRAAARAKLKKKGIEMSDDALTTLQEYARID